MKKHGFTIVEILVVIATLVILATITGFFYINATRDSEKTAVQSDLTATATNLTTLLERDDGFIPTLLTTDLTSASTDTELAFTKTSSRTFCITGTSKNYTEIVFHITETKEVKEGACESVAYTAANCFAFDAPTRTITDYYGNESNNTALPTCPRDVKIPMMINGVDVKVIGNSSFSGGGKAMIGVTIPNTVTEIGEAAFMWASLTQLVIPDSVTVIRPSAFSYNFHLSSLTLSKNLTKLEDSAFRSIGNLTSGVAHITIPEKVTSTGYQVFQYAKLSTISLPNSLTSIGARAFNDSGLQSITLPDSLVTIEERAFEKNNLTSIRLPRNMKKISLAAFANNQITAVTIPEGVTHIEAMAFQGNKITSLSLPLSLKTIDGVAFTSNLLTQVSVYIGTSFYPSSFDPGVNITIYA